MSGSKASSWVAGTVIVSLLVMVAAWFLLISPKLDEAGLLVAEAEDVEASNVVLADRVATLKEQSENIEEYRAELATLREQIPSGLELSSYLRTLDGAAEEHDVTLMTVVPGAALALEPNAETVAVGSGEMTAGQDVAAESEPVAESATEGDAATSEEDDAEVSAPADPVAPPTVATAIPLSIVVVGSYEDVNAFTDDLQQSTARLLLVTSVSSIGQDDAEEGSGRPETRIGDVEATITAYLYASPAPEVPASPDEEEGESTPTMPAPVEGRNPMVPVG